MAVAEIAEKVVTDHLEDAKMTSGETDGVAFVEGTQEEKALVRKIDMWLIPTAWILLLFNYMVSAFEGAMILEDIQPSHYL